MTGFTFDVYFIDLKSLPPIFPVIGKQKLFIG